MATPSNYVLGRSPHEYERLTFQARLLRPYTDRFFRSAGITPGMRVLDVGSGVGDVAMVAGDIVGPGGAVLGIDRDATGLEVATQRAMHQGLGRWVSFQASQLDEFSSDEPFDAIVGRFILMYQSDAAATLRRLLRSVKPGGIVVFHEMDFSRGESSDPPCALWDQAYRLVGEVFRRAGAPPDFGRRMAKTYLDAGLPFPIVAAESVVGGGKGSYVYPWISYTLQTIAPRIAGLGIETDMVIDDSLASRLEAAVVAAQSQILGPIQYGAWTRKPL